VASFFIRLLGFAAREPKMREPAHCSAQRQNGIPPRRHETSL